MGEQMRDGLVDETGESGVDQNRLAAGIEADDTDGRIVEYGAEEGFPLLQDALAVA